MAFYFSPSHVPGAVYFAGERTRPDLVSILASMFGVPESLVKITGNEVKIDGTLRGTLSNGHPTGRIINDPITTRVKGLIRTKGKTNASRRQFTEILGRLVAADAKKAGMTKQAFGALMMGVFEAVSIDEAVEDVVEPEVLATSQPKGPENPGPPT